MTKQFEVPSSEAPDNKVKKIFHAALEAWLEKEKGTGIGSILIAAGVSELAVAIGVGVLASNLELKEFSAFVFEHNKEHSVSFLEMLTGTGVGHTISGVFIRAINK